jgi:uncharacterized protein YlzI (FlbEa/FlbD family)
MPIFAPKWRSTCSPLLTRSVMIQLTRLNNQPLMVNSDLIKFVEKAPDTVLTLISGEKVIVLESAGVVLEKIVAFRQSILCGPTLFPQARAADPASAPPSNTDAEETT